MIVQLGDVIQKILGNEDRLTTEREFYVGGEHFISGNLEVKQRGIIKNEDLGYQFHFPFECGDVLFMTKNPRLRKAGRADFSGICSIATFVIRTKSELVLSQDFLPVIFQSDDFWDYLIANQSGSVNPFIKWGTLEKYTFNLPDISVQNHYCKIIWDLQELINTLEKHSSLLDQLVKSRFIEMFGNPVQSDKYPRIKFGSIIKNIVNGMGSPPQFSDEGYAFIRATNIENGSIVNRDMLHISEETALKLEKYKVHTGDFIFVRSGAYAGDVYVIPDEYDGQYGAYDINVQIDQEKTNPVFLNTLFNSNYMESVIRPLTSRSAQPHLNTKQVAGLDILVPPMELQNEFVDFVKQVDKSRFELQRHLENTRKLQKALINQAFKERTHHDT